MPLPDALPGDWDTYGPGEKIDYFNTMGITPDDLKSVGIGQGDIDWMWNNGYNIGKPQPVIQQPVAPVAPPTFNRPDTPRTIVGEYEEPVVFNPEPYVPPAAPYRPVIQEPVATPVVVAATPEPVIQQPVVTPAPVVDTRRNEINNLYQTLLGREGDVGGLDYWTSTGLGLNDIANYFKTTDEYRARNAPVATPVVVAATPQPLVSAAPVAPIVTAAPIVQDYGDLTGDLEVAHRDGGIFGLGKYILPNIPGIDLRETIGDTTDTTGGAVTPVVSAAPITDYSGGSGSGYTDLGGYDDLVDVSTPFVTTITYPETSRLDVPLETMAAGGGLNVGMGYSMQSPEAEKLGLNARTGETGVGNGYSDDRNQYLNNIQMTATDKAGNPITYQAVYDFASGQTTYRINVNGEVIESKTRPDVEGNVLYIGDRGITLRETGPTTGEQITVTATAEPIATQAPVITFGPVIPRTPAPTIRPPITLEPEVTVTPEVTPTPVVTEIVPATPEATIEVTQEPEPTIVPATPIVTVAPPPPQTPVVTIVPETPVVTPIPETPVVTATPIVTEIVPATPTVTATPAPTIVPETPMPTIVSTPEATIVPATPEVTPIIETLPPETPVTTIVPETPTVTATPGPTSTPTITSTPEGTPDITATPIVETPVVTELVPATPETTIVPETPTVTTTPGPTELPPVTTLVPATPEVTPIIETPGPTGTLTPATPTPGVTETPGPTATEIVPATPEVTTIVETPGPTPSDTFTTPPETTLVPATPEVTDTPRPTATPTASPTATPTATPTITPIPETPVVTDTPEPSATIEASPTPEPTDTPEVSESPEPSPTPTPTPTETNEETPEPTPTATQTVLVPPTPTPTPPRPTATATATPTPPTPTPTPTTQKGRGLAPGLVEATEFYKTYSPVQSKFSWAAQPFQYGPTYSPEVRQAGVGAQTPWGLQQMFQDLSYKDIMDIVSGRAPAPGPVVPNAQRIAAYNAAIANQPAEAQVVLNPQYGAQNKPSVEKITGATAITPVNKEDPRYANVLSALGPNWEQQQQAAADRGDWAEYYRIANIVNNIMQQQETGE